MIRVAIVEDHQMVARALGLALDAEPDIEVVAVSTSGDTSHIEEAEPDVVLVDVRLGPSADGIDLIPRLRSATPDTKVVVLSAWADERSVSRALEAGCDGYLLKTQDTHELVSGVRTAAVGGAAFAPPIVQRLVRRAVPGAEPLLDLSTRELEVLQLLAEGASTEAIARHLIISVNTVRNHVQHLMTKLGAHTRLQLVVQAVRQGLVTID